MKPKSNNDNHNNNSFNSNVNQMKLIEIDENNKETEYKNQFITTLK